MQTNPEINFFSDLYTLLPDVLFPYLSVSSLMMFSATSSSMRYNAIAIALEKLAKEPEDHNDRERLKTLLECLFLYTSIESRGLHGHKTRLMRVLNSLFYCDLSLYENLMVCSLLSRLCGLQDLREKELKELSEFKYKMLIRYGGLDSVLTIAIDAIHQLRLGNHPLYCHGVIKLQDLATSYDLKQQCRKLDLSKFGQIYNEHEARIILFPLLDQLLLEPEESINALWNSLPEIESGLIADIDIYDQNEDLTQNKNLICFLLAFDTLLSPPQKSYIFDKLRFPNSRVLITKDDFEPDGFDALTARWCRDKTIDQIKNLCNLCKEKFEWSIRGEPILWYLLRNRRDAWARFFEFECVRRISVHAESLPKYVYTSLNKEEFKIVFSKELSLLHGYYYKQWIEIMLLRPKDERNELLVLLKEQLVTNAEKSSNSLKPYIKFFMLVLDVLKEEAVSNTQLLFKGITAPIIAKEICQQAKEWSHDKMEAALLACINSCSEEKDKQEILTTVDSLSIDSEKALSKNLSLLVLKLKFRKGSFTRLEEYQCELKSLYMRTLDHAAQSEYRLCSAFWALSIEIASYSDLAEDCYACVRNILVKLPLRNDDLIKTVGVFYQKQPSLLGDLNDLLNFFRVHLIPLSILEQLHHDQLILILSKHLDYLLESSPLKFFFHNVDNLCCYIFNSGRHLSGDRDNDNLIVMCIRKLDKLITFQPLDSMTLSLLTESRESLVKSLRHPDAVTDYFNMRIPEIKAEIIKKKVLSKSSCLSILALKSLSDRAKELGQQLGVSEANTTSTSERCFDEKQESGLRMR